MSISFVQEKHFSGTLVASGTTVPFNSSNTAGNLLVAIIRGVNNDGIHAGTVNLTDSLGNVWNTLQVDSISTSTFQVIYVPICNAGANTVTLTIAVGTTWTVIDVILFEYTPGCVVDQSPAKTSGSGTAGNGSSITTAQTDLILQSCSNESVGSVSPVSASSGFSVRQDSTVNCSVIEELNAPAGTYTPTTTFNTSCSWRSFVTAFQPSNIVVVQSSGPGTSTASASQAQAFASANIAGNCLFISAVYIGTGTPSVTDTQGNTGWQLVQDDNYGGTTHLQSWVCFNCKAGANTVTFHGGAGATFVSISAIAEIRGVNAIDQVPATNNGSNSGTWVSPSVTPSAANSIVIGSYGGSTVAGPSVSSGTQFAANTNSYTTAGYKILSVAAPTTLSFSAGVETPIGAQAFSLIAVYSISGSAGVAGATVSYTGTASGSVTADGSGNYTITALANGSYTITPSKTGYTFSPTSSNQTVSGTNITGVNFTATASGSAYSLPDCRAISTYPVFPNTAVTLNGTKLYTGQTSSNSKIPPTDSRAAGAPVDSRQAGNIPQNSRTPGVFGPNE